MLRMSKGSSVCSCFVLFLPQRLVLDILPAVNVSVSTYSGCSCQAIRGSFAMEVAQRWVWPSRPLEPKQASALYPPDVAEQACQNQFYFIVSTN